MAETVRFLSHYTNRLDAKGRVSIPAPFRAALAQDGFDGLLIHPSLEAPAVDCGGNALLQEIDRLLASFSPYSPERDTLSTALLGMSERLKIDPEGRVQLSAFCREKTGISSDVVFVGLGRKFQIWEPQNFRAHLEEANNRLRELRKTLSARGAAMPPNGARE
ncbi:MAG: division/cell wall cluster transcriptional repressor MraZ [Hyphomicrobiales bacterium]|nr:division/cell wall cluster transcriptional repressor MraZ [Hyphomicrobiales bacterium]